MVSFGKVVQVTIVFCNIGAALGGLRGSLRGTKVDVVPRLDELSEIDMPSIHETDDEMALGLTDAEVADSDENDDLADDESAEGSDEVDTNAAVGETSAESASQTIEHLTRMSSMVDTNDDGVLSPEELKEFAQGLRSKKKWESTRAAIVALDTDGDQHLTHDEIANRLSTLIKSKDGRRFAAADLNGDGILNETEFHAFAHPDSHHMVMKIETEHQMKTFDTDGNGRISFEEFKSDDEKHEDYSESAAREDYYLHDLDGSGDLDAQEFERLLEGHDLLLDSITKAISAVDSDGDGHISISHEIPNGVAGLLNSEFIEDYFYHEYAGRHDEL